MNTKSRPQYALVRWLWVAVLLTGATTVSAADEPTRDEAAQALRRAVTFFHDEVATHGGYLWSYTPNLSQRWGENKASETEIWVQPPGTPSVGLALLRAWQLTGDDYLLEAARDAAHALVWGQLVSGGWGYRINFDPAARPSRRVRDVEAMSVPDNVGDNTTTYDDDNTQSALRFLMQFDRATRFTDSDVHFAVLYGLRGMIRAQYPNGAWPQRYRDPYNPDDYSVRAARYPDTWSRTFTKPTYWRDYTLNDRTIPDCIETMLLAHEVYDDPAYLRSALAGGDFLLLAQMPEPQPAWAQQYNANMEPTWARRFEPPAIVTRESVSVIQALMELYVRTGRECYRGTIPRALDWFDRVQLEDGRHARFYELHTDKPLYFTRKYELVYTDDDMPTHYSFKTTLGVDSLRRSFDALPKRRHAFLEGSSREAWRKRPGPQRVQAIIDALDEEGRWVEKDLIECKTFSHNVVTLAAFIAADRQ